MEKSIRDIFQCVGEKQFELQNIRQLLCEQIQFHPIAAFQSMMPPSSNNLNIDINSVQYLHGQPRNADAIANILKFYSNNNLNITFTQFQSMIFCREDKLVAKLVLERDCGQTPLPPYLLNYLKKLWTIEEQLHSQLAVLRNKIKKSHIQSLSKYQNDQHVNQNALKQDFLSSIQYHSTICPDIIFSLALRYLKKGQERVLSFNQILVVIKHQNCRIVTEFLRSKDQNFNNVAQKRKIMKHDPFLHQNFRQIDQNNCKQNYFSFRQIQSVQNHVFRHNNMPTRQQVKQKILYFSLQMQKSLTKFFKSLEKILKLSAKMSVFKAQLINNYGDCYLQLFNQITKQDYIIPSQLHHYLTKTGIKVQLADLFILFKKYSDPITGRMNRKKYAKIFKSYPQKNKTVPAVELNTVTRRAWVGCLLREVILETKIQRQKMNLAKGVDLRDIFDALDHQQAGRISSTDIDVTCRRITKNSLSIEQLAHLWHRMGLKQTDQYISYQLFMLQMLPRTRQKQQPTHPRSPS